MKTQTEERIAAGLPDPRETATSINRQAADLARTSAELDRYGTQIAARMNAEGALDWSDGEIERCLAGCVSGHKLIPLAKQMRANGMTGQVTASKAAAAVQPLKPELDDCPCERAGDWRLIEASDYIARLIASAPRLKRERDELLAVLKDALALANRRSLTRQKWSTADQHVYERMESAIERAETFTLLQDQRERAEKGEA